MISPGFQSPLSTFLSAMHKRVIPPNTTRFGGGWIAQQLQKHLNEFLKSLNHGKKKRLNVLLLTKTNKSIFYSQSHSNTDYPT